MRKIKHTQALICRFCGPISVSAEVFPLSGDIAIHDVEPLQGDRISVPDSKMRLVLSVDRISHQKWLCNTRVI